MIKVPPKAGVIANVHVNADTVVKTPLIAPDGTEGAFAAKVRGGPVGKANKDKIVTCAVVFAYTITKVSSLPGASVSAVTVKCPLPPFNA